MNVISTIAVLLIPESPKYLYSNKQFKKARDAIHYIAKFNRVKMQPFRFDQELSEPEQLSLTQNRIKHTEKSIAENKKSFKPASFKETSFVDVPKEE